MLSNLFFFVLFSFYTNFALIFMVCNTYFLVDISTTQYVFLMEPIIGIKEIKEFEKPIFIVQCFVLLDK